MPEYINGDIPQQAVGDRATSFASAGVIYSHFGRIWGAAFLGATYVGLSRIAENKH